MKKKSSSLSPITLKIEKIIHGGSGLARYQDKACFIDGVLPGETVRAVVTEQRSQYLRARLCDILEPSAARAQPPCPIAGLCGGCQWQHMLYSQQLACKAAIVEDCLKRIGKLLHVAPSAPVASPLELRYRSRAALKLSAGRLPEIGFFREKTHTVVPVHDCLLLEPALIAALGLCLQQLRKDARIFAGYSDLQLLGIGASPLVLGLWHDRCLSKKIKFAAQTAAGLLKSRSVPVSEAVSGLEFLRDTESFYQVNRLQNLAMIDKVLEFLAPVAGGKILDLFCGCGNFSLFLAKQGSRLTGFDANKSSIQEARNNARINGIETASFITAAVEKLTAGDLSQGCDAVLVNPPRSGCQAQTLQLIAAARPEIIVYVSCNPATLSRDLRLLAQAHFTIEALQPFDMFPQTCHVETVVKLKRNPPDKTNLKPEQRRA